MLTSSHSRMQGRKPQPTPTQPRARDPASENHTIHPNREHPRVKTLKTSKKEPSKMGDKARAPAARSLLHKNLGVVKAHTKSTGTRVKERQTENPPTATKKTREEPPPRQPDVGRDPLSSRRKKPSLKNVLHSSAPRVRELPKSVVRKVRSDVKRGR